MRPAALATIAALLGLPAAAAAQPSATPPLPPPPVDGPSSPDAAAEPGDAPAPSVDDLARAADATADAAAVGADETASAPTAVDDIDLASLGLDPDAPTYDDKLDLYGFASINYSVVHFSPGSTFLKDSRQFSSGNLHLYLAKNLSARWRYLTEVRFLYIPNGSQALDGTTITTATNDPNDFARPVSWSGTAIERAYIEYDAHPRLTIRAGRFLTPYGIWNIDHGPPAIISANRPFTIGEQYFPEHQTGLELLGTRPFGEYTLGYHATVSNGRNPTEATSDNDKQLAVGGRLELTAPWAGTARLGVSGYRGRYTDAITTFGVAPPSYDEVSFGADAQWDHGRLHLQGELLVNQRRYLDGQRARTAVGFAPDDQRWGYYALATYHTDRLWNATPFAFYEIEHPVDHTLFGWVRSTVAGVNVRPLPTVVLKGQYLFARGHDGGLLDGLSIHMLNLQSTWVF